MAGEPSRADPGVRPGRRARRASVAAVTAESDVLITMLPDSPDVEEVVLGEQGVLVHARPGLLLIDMSTIRPQSAMVIAEAASAVGVRTLDAPVSGGEAGAINATLTPMVGGAAEDFAAALPVLGAMGKIVAHVGGSSGAAGQGR